MNPLGTCTLGKESDVQEKRLRAYFKASPLVLKDTHGLESHALAGTQVAVLERQERIIWNSAKVSSWRVSVFSAQSQRLAYSGARAYSCVLFYLWPFGSCEEVVRRQCFLEKGAGRHFRNRDQDVGMCFSLGRLGVTNT